MHSLKQDSTGLGGHKARTDSPFLKGSLSILGRDSVLGGVCRRGEQLEPWSLGCPGPEDWGMWAGKAEGQAASLVTLQDLLPPVDIFSFYFSPFPKISGFFINGSFRNSNDGLLCFSAIYLLCDIQSTLLCPIYTPLSALFFFFLSHTYSNM